MRRSIRSEWQARVDEATRIDRREGEAGRTDSEAAVEARRDRIGPLWLLGEYERCTAEFASLLACERRIAAHAGTVPARQPVWEGEPLVDRHLLVDGDQGGLGDVILASRLLPSLAGMAARVTVVTHPQLVRLLDYSFAPLVEVRSHGEGEVDADYRLDLLSVVLQLGLSQRAFCRARSYLRVPPESVIAWRDKLKRMPRPWIGLCWTGALPGETPDERSVPAASLRRLLHRGGATFVSLQQGRRLRELSAPGARGGDFGNELGDFLHTAALIQTLDLVLSCDTSIAHLAGALGRPLWLLLLQQPFDGWLLDGRRPTSPLYPSARLWFQSEAGDWNGVVRRVAETLASFRLGPASAWPELETTPGDSSHDPPRRRRSPQRTGPR